MRIQNVARFSRRLIALGLCQFIPHLGYDPTSSRLKGRATMRDVCELIVRHMVPARKVRRVAEHVSRSRSDKSESNPIRYYFDSGRPPVTLHFVTDLGTLKVLPPRDRDKDQLPYQWQTYLYPDNGAVSARLFLTAYSEVMLLENSLDK